MRVNRKNIEYAISHPWKTLRYLRWQDRIPYEDIARYLPLDPVIVEAGAADGCNTGEMAEWWPRSVIHAFEPVPSARTLLERNVANVRDRVHIYPFALGEAGGCFEMHVSGSGDAPGSQSSSLLPPTGHHEEFSFVKFQDTIQVEVTSLDNWAALHKVKKGRLLLVGPSGLRTPGADWRRKAADWGERSTCGSSAPRVVPRGTLVSRAARVAAATRVPAGA